MLTIALGSFYVISMWYKRHEAQKRYTFFFASTTLAGAFGGLLASAIGKMNGLRGYLGWRWVFILEGVLTCAVSFVWWFIISDFPEDAKWLSEAEREYLKARLRADQGKSAIDRRITFKDVVNCFKDYKFIFGWLMYFGLIVPGESSQAASCAHPEIPPLTPLFLLSSLWLCLLCPDDHQVLRVRQHSDSTALGPTVGLRFRF